MYRSKDFKLNDVGEKYVYSKAHTGTVLVISMVQTKFKNRTLRKVSECISS